MRGVLALFEGVATGAADGYARMAGRPAADAAAPRPRARQRPRQPAQRAQGARRRSSTSSATTPPTTSSTTRSSSPTSRPWRATCRRSSARRRSPTRSAADAADAVAAAIGPPGQVATLILPADVSWSERRPSRPPPVAAPAAPVARRTRVDAIADGAALAASRLRCSSVARRCRERGAASAPAASPTPTGAKLLCETFPTRLERGAGVPPVERHRLPRRVRRDAARRARATSSLVDAKAPVSFFAYPGKASYLVPEGCEVHTLADRRDDVGRRARRARRGRRRRADAATRRRAGRGPTCRPARSPPKPCAQAARRPAARGRDRVRRGQHLGAVRRRRSPPARRATTGCASPAARSARGSRSPSAPRSPVPTAR